MKECKEAPMAALACRLPQGTRCFGERRGIGRRMAATLASIVVVIGLTTASIADEESSPIFGVKIPEGYRSWELIAPSHEEGNFNELRAILGNDIAVRAY